MRKVAYSTFTIIRILDNKTAHIIQFDNPATIVLRKGELFDYPRVTRVLSGKTIWESTFPIELDDVFIAMSDGAEYAGVGDLMNFGWTARLHRRLRHRQLSARKQRQVHRGPHHRRMRPPLRRLAGR